MSYILKEFAKKNWKYPVLKKYFLYTTHIWISLKIIIAKVENNWKINDYMVSDYFKTVWCHQIKYDVRKILSTSKLLFEPTLILFGKINCCIYINNTISERLDTYRYFTHHRFHQKYLIKLLPYQSCTFYKS